MRIFERDPREERLPRWVQEKLSSLRMEVNVQARIIAELKAEIPETNTFVSDYVRGDTPLPPNARIDFVLGDDSRADMSRKVQVYISQEGVLEIQGGRTLAVEPRASNSLRIRLDSRR